MIAYVHSHTLAAPVHLLARYTPLGRKLAEVYTPILGRRLTLPAADLLPLADASRPSR